MHKSKINNLDRPFPSKLFLEATTRCNLRCRMCVKQTSDCGIVTADMAPSTFEALKPAIPGLSEVIISGIGEPLLHPRLERMIEEIKARLPASGSVGLQTNGTLLTGSRIERLCALGLDSICISVDAVTDDLFGSIRVGAQFERLEAALSHLEKTKILTRRVAPLVGIQFVLMKNNMRHLPQVLRWAGRLGVDFAIVSHLLPYDPDTTRQVVYPPGSDAAAALFNEWRKKISRQGLRIENYFAASMKYYKSRTPDENRLIAMVEAMKTEGVRKDLFVDLTRLLIPRDASIDLVEEIFEEAQTVAQSSGVDLMLPARQPTHARHCRFIEEGSVFVAWDGSVAPCHFTWHPYACFPEGRKKVVQPVCFGRIESTPLIEIWNSTPFRSFREGVRLYDYPYCGDCGLSPCDYITRTVFEHDCHTNTVPCCDCLWPTGILNCLQ
jgi:putative metalloenzyme radical SAM/SPASM domain maturase